MSNLAEHLHFKKDCKEKKILEKILDHRGSKPEMNLVDDEITSSSKGINKHAFGIFGKDEIAIFNDHRYSSREIT